MSKDINIPNTSSPKKFMKKIKNSENDSNIQNKKIMRMEKLLKI
jgi:hypothetical protein